MMLLLICLMKSAFSIGSAFHFPFSFISSLLWIDWALYIFPLPLCWLRGYPDCNYSLKDYQLEFQPACFSYQNLMLISNSTLSLDNADIRIFQYSSLPPLHSLAPHSRLIGDIILCFHSRSHIIIIIIIIVT